MTGENRDGLPESWTETTIGGLIRLNPKNEIEDDVEAGFIPMSQLGTRFMNLPSFDIRTWREIKKGYTHFKNDDVLLAKITPCFENGKSGIPQRLPNDIGAGSTEYFVCRPEVDVLHSRYLLAYFQTEDFIRNGTVQMTGSVGHKRVPKEYLTDTSIPLPPLAEQIRIADKLATLLARVDAGRERLERVPKLVKQFRQSVLNAAVSGELTREWRGGEDADWEYLRADEVCTKVQSGGTPKEGFVEDNGIPFLKVYNIVSQKIDFEYKPQYVTLEVHQSSLKKSIALPGDVLMNIVGPPLGKVALLPEGTPQWNINQAITLFRAGEKVTPRWIYYLLLGGVGYTDVLNETKGIVGQVNISLSQCRAFIFPVPPLPEQAEIVRRVEALFAIANRFEARYQAALASFDRLTPALLAKAFQGDLVPQDPNDEPASVLLERIQAQRASTASTSGRGRKAKSAAKEGATPKRPGRPKAGAAPAPIPQASSDEDAIRQLEAQKLQRAQGTRQVSLFGSEE